MFTIGERPDTLTPQEIEAWRAISPATVGHLLEFACMGPEVRPLWGPVKLVGPALTVQAPPQDGAIVHYALDLARPGDVVVLDRGGDTRHAAWGELVTRAAMARGVAGVVTNGALTDRVQIQALSFPAFGRAVSALTVKTLGLGGAINVPVQVGGVVVHPGDLVLADDDGVVVLRPEQARSLLAVCQQREAREQWVREELARGRSLAEISGARRLVQEALTRQRGQEV